MFPDKFNAILMDCHDKILEYGFASVSLKNKTVDFSAGFVPLIKIGTIIKIACTVNGQYTHIFTGEAFLCAKKFLRIISVNCRLLSGAENVLSINVDIPAKISVMQAKGGLFKLNHIPKKSDCTICSISAQKLCFTSKQFEFDWSSELQIDINQPIFSEDVRIMAHACGTSLLFGNKAKYYCCITSVSDFRIMELINFVKSMSIANLQGLLASES